jgi:hypothetical protein
MFCVLCFHVAVLASQVSLQPGQFITLQMPNGAGGGNAQAELDGLLNALLAGDTAKVLGGVGSLLVSVTVI